MLVHMLWGRGFDYPLHLEFVRDIREGTLELLPHPLFHLVVLGVVPLLPPLPFLETYKQAGLIVGVALYLLTGLVLYMAYVRPALRGGRSRHGAALAVTVVLLLMLVAPVNIISWREGKLFWGYFLPNIHMNPTLTILKPLALLLFVYIAAVFSDESRFNSWSHVLAAAVLTVLSGLAKPNFAIAFLPALAVFAAVWFYQKKPIYWRLLLLGIVLPAGILLALQYLALSGGSASGGGIAFSPLQILNERGIDRLPLKFILSILFPLAAYSLYFPAARRDAALNLAWLIFIVGAFYAYTLIEPERMLDANFTWSGQIGVTVLFAVSLVFVIRQTRQTGFTRRGLLLAGVLALHGLSGLFWYYADSVSPGFVWY